MNNRIGYVNYNGVTVTLRETENNFILTVLYSKKWKDEGHRNATFTYDKTQEDIARMNFRTEVRANISIH